MMKLSALIPFLTVVACSAPRWLFVEAQSSGSASTIASTNERSFDFVLSSSFKMTLFPTKDPLDATAANKVQHAIKTTLLLSTSVTTNFIGVDDIDVMMHRIEYDRSFEPLHPLSSFATTPASSLVFTVETVFLVNDKEDEGRLPSTNALDNLIVRTFSQPSSKASFLVTLGLARDPILNDILDIEIDIIPKPTELPVPQKDRRLSMIDIVLIIASSFIFFGIIAVICYYHNSGSDDGQAGLSATQAEAKTVPEANEHSDIHIDTSDSKESTTNGSPGSSPKEAIAVLAQEEINQTEHSDVMPFEENIIEGSSLESSLDGQSVVIPAAESPEASYASSTASTTRRNNSSGSRSSSVASSASSSTSSSSSSSSSSPSSSSPSICEDEDSSKDSDIRRSGRSASPKLLGAEQPNYFDSSVSSSSKNDDLSSRLLHLSSISAFDLNRRFNLYSSSNSAPPILEDVREEEEPWVNERKVDDKSVFSARSASDDSFDSSCQAHSEPYATRGKRGYWVGPNFRETAQQFHENWIESERKALEDIEEGSVEDVFQIDVERAGALEEDRSKASGHSSVSEWMKNIRVVGSASETQSSVEHSSVEPRSYAKDSNSVDPSLEESLATSLVEV